MDMITWTLLRKESTNLPVNLWIDEIHNRKRYPSRLVFQNNTSNVFTGVKDLIPISVEDDPKVLLEGFTPKISSSDLQAVKSFISINKEIILKYMNDPDFEMIAFITAMK